MIKVITRYFDTAAQAREAERRLLSKRLSARILRIFSQTEGLESALTAAGVLPETAEAYAGRMASDGGAVLMVRTGHRPLGIAQTAREVMSEMGARDMGERTEEVIVKEKPMENSSLLAGNPRLLTRDRDPNATNFYMANWPIALISRRKPNSNSLIPRHGRMANWPIALTARIQPRDEFAFPRHARMANLIFPLTIRRKPSDNFIFPRHARMADVILPLLNGRKPYTGSLIPRHHRFANWPFPHLINGKQHTNSLMAGAPRMAAGPMNLISKRKPFTGSIFGRHARMGNFILPLLSKRKPFTGSIVGRHSRMANFILPLVVKNSSAEKGRFGFPTLLRR